jgi:hypothetical protein
LNIDLASPIYVTCGWSECYRVPDHRVCAGDTMRSGFITRSDYVMGGALIFKLQKKQSNESTELGRDTSSTVHLLVFWRSSDSSELYADVVLIEHNKGFNWNKSNLRKLYRKNISQFRLSSDSATGTWSLNDNTALMTTSEIMNEDSIVNITISKVERHHYVRMPTRVDLER